MPLGAEAKSRHMGSLKIIAGHLKEGSEHNRLRVTLAITDHQPAPTEEVLGHDSIWNISVVRRTSKCRSNGAGVNAFSLCATWSFILYIFSLSKLHNQRPGHGQNAITGFDNRSSEAAALAAHPQQRGGGGGALVNHRVGHRGGSGVLGHFISPRPALNKAGKPLGRSLPQIGQYPPTQQNTEF